MYLKQLENNSKVALTSVKNKEFRVLRQKYITDERILGKVVIRVEYDEELEKGS